MWCAEFILHRKFNSKEDIIERLKNIRKTNVDRNYVITEKILDVHKFADEITEKSGFSSRATVLGYIQRGGNPCPDDRILGSRMGAYAIELLNDGIYGVCVGVRDSRMIHLPFANVLDQARPKNELYKIVKKIS